jgi:5-methyltetrahydropteroyltriglutamate--homocysteine methyltransferase
VNGHHSGVAHDGGYNAEEPGLEADLPRRSWTLVKRSTERILTTHVGSLARPAALDDLIRGRRARTSTESSDLAGATASAVKEVVKKQVDIGLAVVNDGEQSKPSYTSYVSDRLDGLEWLQTPWEARQGAEAEAFPEYYATRHALNIRPGPTTTQLTCTGPLAWKDFSAVETDIANLRSATEHLPVADAFMTAASPGVIVTSIPNRHYPSDEAYLQAAAEVMKREYAAIVDAGFILQLDCPELAMSRDRTYWKLSPEEFRSMVALHVEAVNYAVAGLPAELMRIHICWGRPERPHTTDVPLQEIVDLILRANPAGLQITGANGRHEHEWSVWKGVRLPEGKVLIPGVIDSTTNIVEHPEVVAERILRYAQAVGRENLIAGVDCGFGNSPAGGDVEPQVAWAKLAALAEGARLASERLGY